MTTGTLEQAPSEYLSVGIVAQRYGTHPETIRRWLTRGACAAGGVRVKLRSIKIGGLRKTTWQWVEEFRLACEGTGESVAASTPARVDRKAQADQERLAARLKPRKGKR